MSYDLGIFFNASESFDDIVRHLEQLFHLTLIKREDELFGIKYGCEVLNLIVTVYKDHGMIDDLDLGFAFSNYQYAVDITIFARSEIDKPFARTTALFVAYRLFECFGWPCIVVEETHKKLLELPPSGQTMIEI